MKYYIIAGEASGDLHGSNLIKALKNFDINASVRCWGGDKMSAAGGVVVRHISDLAFMGFAEVLRNLPAIMRNISFCKEDIESFSPDVLVLIDYPGFNLRIAKWARRQGFKVVYYISPQIWAWKESRIRQIKRDVDKMLVIFPFEEEYYHKWNFKADYVGHPLVPVIEDYIHKNSFIEQRNTIALLPGSRKQEIRAKLPVMLKATVNFPEHTFYVAKAPTIEEKFYNSFLAGYGKVGLRSDTYSLLMESQAALVTSGTATLETALFNVPEVVCYKTGNISYAIGKRLVKLKFICIVNLIMNREVVKELIQYDLTPENISIELNKIIFDKEIRNRILADYGTLRNVLSHQGNASENAAKEIIQMIS